MLEWLKEDDERYIYFGGSSLENKDAIHLIKSLYSDGATRVEVEEDEDESADTIYITIDPKKITKQLLESFVELNPDEFDKVKGRLNTYRLWWD